MKYTWVSDVQRRNIMLGGAALMVGLPASKMLFGTWTAAAGSYLRGMYPPPNKMTIVNERKVYADQRGVGPDVVLIHGANGNSRDFTFRFADLLVQHGFRVTSFDRPGLGWSDDLGEEGVSPLVQAQFLIAAAKAFNVEKPIVLGQSYGGSVAIAWALIEPDYISGLVSVSGATNVWQGSLGLWYSMSASPVGEFFLAPLVEAFASQGTAASVLESIFAPDPVPEGYLEYLGVELSFRRRTFIANANQVGGLKRHLEIMEPNYGSLKLPVEIVFGDADTIVPVQVHGQKLASQIKKANLVVIPGAGHMPHHAHQLVVLEAVRRVHKRSR